MNHTSHFKHLWHGQIYTLGPGADELMCGIRSDVCELPVGTANTIGNQSLGNGVLSKANGNLSMKRVSNELASSGIVVMHTFSPVNPNFNPGALHPKPTNPQISFLPYSSTLGINLNEREAKNPQEIYFESHLPLYANSSASGPYEVQLPASATSASNSEYSNWVSTSTGGRSWLLSQIRPKTGCVAAKRSVVNAATWRMRCILGVEEASE